MKKLILEACPFCGSKAEFLIRKTKPYYAVVCSSSIIKDCYIYSGSDERYLHDKRAWDDVIYWFSIKEDAINVWNKRSK